MAEGKGSRPRYGPRMLQVTAYVRDHPGESSNSVSYAAGPHGIRIHGQKAVNRALSAGLIENRGKGRVFELHITDTGRDALEAVWPRYAGDAHTWKAADLQALDPRFVEVTHRDSVDTRHDPRGVTSTGTTWTGLPVRFWLPLESYWTLRGSSTPTASSGSGSPTTSSSPRRMSQNWKRERPGTWLTPRHPPDPIRGPSRLDRRPRWHGVSAERNAQSSLSVVVTMSRERFPPERDAAEAAIAKAAEVLS